MTATGLDELLKELPVDSRKPLKQALKLCNAGDFVDTALMRRALCELASSIRRTEQRRDSDARTDRQRRRLIGARVPWQRMAVYRKAAEVKGLSLYRFMVNALDADATVRALDAGLAAVVRGVSRRE